MWPDPTDVSKRKPRYLQGTPANKLCYLFSFGVIGLSCALYNLFPYIPHFQKKIDRLAKRTDEHYELDEIRKFLADPLVSGTLNYKKESYEKQPD